MRLVAIYFSLLTGVVLRFSLFPGGMGSSEKDWIDHFLGSVKQGTLVVSSGVVSVYVFPTLHCTRLDVQTMTYSCLNPAKPSTCNRVNVQFVYSISEQREIFGKIVMVSVTPESYRGPIIPCERCTEEKEYP